MAKRKILVVTGQSNATTLSDAQSWEEQHPNIRLRSSLATPVQFTTDIVPSEQFTMPHTFAGGPQAGRYGELTRGAWQSVDTHGKVVNAVRFLTHYNPTPSYRNDGVGATQTFPGKGSIVGFESGAVISTSVRWQYDPSGIVLTRERTGSTHTITSTSFPVTQVTVSPPFFPPPEIGERFSYVPTGGATSTTTELRLVQQFGGLHDIGTAVTGAVSGSLGVVDIGASEGRVVCRGRPGYPGAPVSFARSTSVSFVAVVLAIDLGTETITLLSNPYIVGDVVVFTDGGGGTLTGISFGTSYYVVYSSGNDIRVSTTKGGAPDNITAFTGPVVASLGWSNACGITENTTYYITRYAEELEELDITQWVDASERINIVGHGLVRDERVRFEAGTGSLPPEITAGTDYYVRIYNINNIEVSTTRGGPALAFSAATAGAKLVRMEAYFHFYVSASVGGPEITFVDDVRDAAVSFQEAFRGSLTGMVITALTGANAGESVPAGDVYLDSVTGKAVVRLGAAFSNAPAAGDTYSITPPQVNGTDVPFEKWAYFLPWCPFEGMAQFALHPALSGNVSEQLGFAIFAAVPTVWPNDVVRFWPSDSIAPSINPGQRYYATVATGGACYLSETYDGAPIIGAVNFSATGTTAATIEHQEGKTNPFPPGFNYPNHHEAVGQYQPFWGLCSMTPRQTFATGLAVALAEYYGETIYVVHVAYGGTNIGHTDTPNGRGSWSSTGDPNNIFQDFTDALDSAALALAAQGDEGECVGIVYVQGEGDASFEDLANRYKQNARTLKTAMRKAIRDRGLFSRPAEELRWIDPHCQTTPWAYADVVNAAKDELVAEDPYSATFDQQDLERMSQLTGPNGLKFNGFGDPIHYSGNGMTELERRAYAAWLSIGESSVDVEIANMALSLIGEPAKVFSLDPAADKSTQALECSKFFRVARDTVLESHSWGFITKTVTLVETTKDAIRQEWAHAYLLPADMLAPLEVVPPGAYGSASSSELTPWWRSPNSQLGSVTQTGYPFKIERDSDNNLVLFTNVEGALLRYNRKLTSAVEVPMKFKLAVARKLASLIAGQFVKGEAGAALAQRLDALARYEMGDAAATDAMRQQNNPPQQNMPWDR